MKRILITGGMGYVGGRIARYLSDNTDHHVILADKIKTLDIPEWLKKGEISYIDVLQEDTLIQACKDVDIIIHLAAMNEIDCSSNPEQALMVNGLGTLKLLQACEKNKIKKFIYFSTAHVYGAPLAGNIDEKRIPRPIHPYSITHKIAEDYVLSYNDNKAFTGIVIRLSNSFGYPASGKINRWTLIVNDLCKQAVMEKKLVLKTSGIQKRDFITLKDVARAVDHLIDLEEKRIDNGIFNVGGENSQSIFDMARLISKRCSEVLGYHPDVIRPDPSKNETENDLIYSIEKLKSTGFILEKNINHEIDGMLQFCSLNFSKKDGNG
jgi:UDP-glucose 4-epimerase